MSKIGLMLLAPLALLCSGLAAQYTFPTWGNPGQTGDWVSNITIGAWNQTIPETVADNTYHNGVGPGTLQGGTQVTVDLFKTTNWTQSVTLFIDYNMDGDYEDAGEAVGSIFLGGGVNTGGQIVFTPPANAPSGTTRMRLLVRFASQTLPLTPTGSFTFGQCDDYDVTISNGSNVTAQRNASSFPASIANNSTVNVALGSSLASLDLLFEIQNGNTTVSNTLTASVVPSGNISGFVQSQWEATGVAGTTASPTTGTFNTAGTISVTLTSTDGSTSGVLAFDLNVVAPVLTVSNNNHLAGLIVPGSTNYVTTAFAASSNVGNQVVVSATLTKSGTMPDAGIAAVRLVVDANSNGVVDAGDTQLGTDQVFSSGSATIAISVPVAAPVDVLIVIDTSASASGSISIDLTAITVSTGSVTGLPIAGVSHATLTAATLPYSTGFETGQPSNLMLVTSGTFPTLTSNTGTTLAATPTTPANASRFQTLQTVTNAYGTVNPTGGSNFMMLDYPNGLAAGAYDFLFDLSAYNPASDAIIFECNWVDCNDEDGTLDAIFFSDDGGATWLCPYNLPFATAVDDQWNFLQLDVTAFVAANAMSFTSQFIVRLQASDDFDVFSGVDGFGLDDVTMYRLDDPEIQLVDPSSNNAASGATINLGNVGTGATTTFTWTIDNLGLTNDLVISSLTAAPSGVGNVSVNGSPVLTPASPITAGNSATFDTDVMPSGVGAFEFTITVGNNDPNENPYTIIVQGTGAAPNMTLERPASTVIPATTGTDSVSQNSTPGGTLTLTYTIRNSGTGPLIIAGISTANPNNCTATAGAPGSTTVAVSGTTTFDVDITPAGLGAWDFDLTVNSNDPTNPAYTITVDGTATVDPPSIQAPNVPPASSPVLITEVAQDPGTTGDEYIELTNVSGAPVDISGWVIVVYSTPTNLEINYTMTGATLAAGDTHVLTDFSSQTYVAGAEYLGGNILAFQNYGVALFDNTTTLMDFVCFGTFNPGAVTNPVAIGTDWNGVPATNPATVANSSKRTGTQDNNDASDWTTTTGDSLDVPNAGLTLPFSISGGATIGGAYPAYTGSIYIGDNLYVEFTATDPNPGDTLSFNITVTGGSLSAAQAGFNETFPYTPTGGASPHMATLTGTAAMAGDIELTIEVSDGALTDTYTYTLTIDDPPEMDLFYNAAPVADGGTVNEDMLNVGFTQFTFTIENNGGLDVNLTGTPLVEVTAGANLFSAAVSQNPTTPIAGSGSTTFTIDVTPLGSATGTYDFTVSIENNDPNENPYDFTVTGNLISNVPPVVTIPTGSNWVDAGGGLFTLTVDPGDTINDSLEVNDGTPDLMTIAVTNPTTNLVGLTTQPVDVTTPTAGPLFLDWMGTADASNPPGNFDWLIDIDDGTTVVSITARIVLVDVDPQHTAVTGITGDGSAATPYEGQFVQGDPVTTFLDIANVTDPNVGQTLTLQNTNRTGGTAAGGSGFSFSLAGGVLSANPTAALVAADVGTNIYTMEVSDGTGSPVTINVTLTVLGASGAMTFSNTSPLPSATVNQTYTVTLAVSGGTGPYTFAVVNSTSLPVGLILNPNTGEISGTPNATGVYTFDARALDSTGDTATMTFQLSVNSASGGGGGGGSGGGGCTAGSSTWPALLGILALMGIAVMKRRRRA